MEEKEDRNFEEVLTDEIPIWEVKEEGDSIDGVYVNKQTNVGSNKSNLYTIQNRQKNDWKFWGNYILDEKMAMVRVGDFIRVTFKGTRETSNKRTVKIFKVEVAK